MKRIAFIMLLWAGTWQICHGSVNDSLAALIEKSTGRLKIDAMNELSRNYTILAKKDSALLLATKALNRSEELNCPECIAESYISLYFHAYYYDDTKQGQYAYKLLEVSLKAGYNRGIAYSYIFSSDLAADSSMLQAYNYLAKAKKLFQGINDNEGLAITYWRMGDLFLFRPDYTEALKYLVEAIKIYDRSRPKPGDIYNRYHYSMICNSMGIAYKNTGDFGNSKVYYSKYLEESNSIGEMWGVAIAYNNLGNLEWNTGNNDKALDYYNKSMDIWAGIGVNDYNGEMFLNMGNAYLAKGEYAIASACFDSSYKYSIDKKSLDETAKVESCRGNLLAAQKEFKKAIVLYKKSIELIESGDNLKILAENYQALAAAYDSLGNYESAYYYYKLYNTAKDSLFSSEKAKEVGLLTANYEIQRKIEEQKRETELTEQREMEAVKRRNTIQYSGISIFVAALFTFIFLSGKFRISDTALEVLVFVSLLLLFEFIQVMFDPLINKITGSEPFYLLLTNLVIVGAIIPLDAYLEKLMNSRLKKRMQ